MERALMLGDFNTWSDWELILTRLEIAPPEVKTNYVDIEGMDGALDLTEVLSGEPTYKDRPVRAGFCASEGIHEDRVSLFDAIAAAIHGRKLRIVEPDHPNHYFLGRISVKDVLLRQTYGEFSIEAICEPWRYSNQKTVVEIPVESSEPVAVEVCNGGRKTVCPSIAVAGSVTFTCNGVTSSASDGTYKVLTFRLAQGSNTIHVSGSGSLTLTYREAVL